MEIEMRGYLRGLTEGQRVAEELVEGARETAYAQGREVGYSQGVAESGVSSAIIPRVPGIFSWEREGMAETFEIPSSSLPTGIQGIPSLSGFDGRSVSLISAFIFSDSFIVSLLFAHFSLCFLIAASHSG